jgi:glycosyltransferase involved in cell wall biosynthesis
MPRLAWFSPMPPVPTGVATCSADLIRSLGAEHEIDVFVDEPVVRAAHGTRSAHELVWLHQQRPYDLVVYQLGNSSHHDYIWPYLFRYPGLLVMHDARLHHARAAALLRTFRADDYRTEFAWNHPDANRDLAELAVAGFDNHLHYAWPMTRLAIRASKHVAVHRPEIADRIRQEIPDARVEAIRLGHGRALRDADRIRHEVRTSFGIADDAVVFGCYGGLTPAKRIPQILHAFAATREYAPNSHLLLAGAEQPTYDVRGEVSRLGLDRVTTLTGYLATDEAFTSAVAACDVALNLRWPTAEEVSGPWLHALALSKPTVIIDLAHLASVPAIDPRTWLSNAAWTAGLDTELEPIAIAIDILDEDHSLRLAMRRLASDPVLRVRLGEAGLRYWHANHTIEAMVSDYRRVLAAAMAAPPPAPPLPAHLTNGGAATLERELEHLGVAVPWSIAGAAAP